VDEGLKARFTGFLIFFSTIWKTDLLAHRSPIIFVLLASFFFASSTFVAKMAGVGFFGSPIHPLQVTHSRFVFGLITVLIMFLYI